MYLSNSLAFHVVPLDLDEVPATRTELLKLAGDQAASATIGSVRGTKGAGQRR